MLCQAPVSSCCHLGPHAHLVLCGLGRWPRAPTAPMALLSLSSGWGAAFFFQLTIQGQAGWSTWWSCRCPCILQRSWTRWPLQVPSKSIDSVIQRWNGLNEKCLLYKGEGTGNAEQEGSGTLLSFHYIGSITEAHSEAQSWGLTFIFKSV